MYSMKKISLYVMIVFYIAAGINHFWHPEPYVGIMPSWIPWHKELVIISGICEILLGFLLLFSATRRFAAWGIILLLIGVFPANIQMLINFSNESNPDLWVAIIRLPLQLLLIWWAYGFAKRKELKIKEVSLKPNT